MSASTHIVLLLLPPSPLIYRATAPPALTHHRSLKLCLRQVGLGQSAPTASGLSCPKMQLCSLEVAESAECHTLPDHRCCLQCSQLRLVSQSRPVVSTAFPYPRAKSNSSERSSEKCTAVALAEKTDLCEVTICYLVNWGETSSRRV